MFGVEGSGVPLLKHLPVDHLVQGSGFRVWGLGCKVWGLGFSFLEVSGLEFGVWGLVRCGV